MATESSRPIRARNPEEKQQRRSEILKAAERLWENTPYSELSMNQVAREAKLAKGTLYLYYDTKEELFLSLLIEHLQAWFTDVQDLIKAQPVTSAAQITDVLVASLRPHLSLRRLILLLSTVLERNIKPDSSTEFRRLVRRNLHDISQQLDLPPEVTFRILSHLYALVLGWHEASEAKSISYPANDQEKPKYERPDFETEIALALRAIVPVLMAEQTS